MYKMEKVLKRNKSRCKKIVGLSWKKVTEVIDENTGATAYSALETAIDSPLRVSKPAKGNHGSEICTAPPRPLQENRMNEDKELSTSKQYFQRSLSVRGVVGSIRQKLRKSTRRRKQLFEVHQLSPMAPSPCPYSPITPAQRRSERIARRHEVQMSSPFGLETPNNNLNSRTPLRDGLHDPRRFNFSSPGTFQHDLNHVSEGMMRLNEIAQDLEMNYDILNNNRSSPFQRGRNTVIRRKRSSQRPLRREPPKETML